VVSPKEPTFGTKAPKIFTILTGRALLNRSFASVNWALASCIALSIPPLESSFFIRIFALPKVPTAGAQKQNIGSRKKFLINHHAVICVFYYV
jgi:hypothetical protein